MNKELEEAIKSMQKFIGCRQDMTAVTAREMSLILKELERLQEENKKMQTEIAEHVYWDSTPINEIKKMYIPKDQIIEKTKEIQQEYELLLEHQNGQESNRTKYLRGKIHMGQELLEGK